VMKILDSFAKNADLVHGVPMLQKGV